MCTTLGRPLVSPGFAGCHAPADQRQRTALHRWGSSTPDGRAFPNVVVSTCK